MTFTRLLSLASMNLKASKTRDSIKQNVYDVTIVGGGIMGSSSAYFLANRMRPEMEKICVIERDPTVSKTIRTEIAKVKFMTENT